MCVGLKQGLECKLVGSLHAGVKALHFHEAEAVAGVNGQLLVVVAEHDTGGSGDQAAAVIGGGIDHIAVDVGVFCLQGVAVQIKGHILINGEGNDRCVLQQYQLVAGFSIPHSIGDVIVSQTRTGVFHNSRVMEGEGVADDIAFSFVLVVVYTQLQSHFQVGISAQELGSEVNTAVEVLHIVVDFLEVVLQAGLAQKFRSEIHNLHRLVGDQGHRCTGYIHPVFAPAVVLTGQITVAVAVGIEGHSLIDSQNKVSVPAAIVGQLFGGYLISLEVQGKGQIVVGDFTDSCGRQSRCIFCKDGGGQARNSQHQSHSHAEQTLDICVHRMSSFYGLHKIPFIILSQYPAKIN